MVKRKKAHGDDDGFNELDAADADEPSIEEYDAGDGVVNEPEPDEELPTEPFMEPVSETQSAFGPPKIDKDGKPVCFGQFISGRKCNCEWSVACVFYTYDQKGTKSRQTRWRDYETMPIIEGMDWPDESGEPSLMQSFRLPDGRMIEASSINLPIIQICVWMAIENPASMRALMLKMDPDVRSLQDMADILKISKQAVQKRVAGELGIGKRQFKEQTLLQLSEVEMKVYKLCVQDGMNCRRASNAIGISAEMATRILYKFRRMGIIKRAKNQSK